MFDYIIRNGLIVDGLGNPGKVGDLGISNQSIAEIGQIKEGGKNEIDATGLVVAPGFIDPHTHYDAQITWDPFASCSSWHGVTSLIFGNCGFGIAPCRPGSQNFLMRLLSRVEGIEMNALQKGIHWDFETYPQYLAMIEKQGIWVNVSGFIGHSVLRQFVMGEKAWTDKANEAELTAMENIVYEAMLGGAVGISTSTHKSHIGDDGSPIPSRVASREEIIRLAKAMRRSGRGLVQISVDSSVDESGLDIVADLARQADCPVTFGAIRFDSSQPNRHLLALQKIDKLTAEGLRLYPQVTCWKLTIDFNLKNSTVFSRMPVWRQVLASARSEWSKIFKDPQFRETFKSELEKIGRSFILQSKDNSMHINSVSVPSLEPLVGKTIFEVSQLIKLDPWETFFNLAIQDNEIEFKAVVLNTDEEAVATILQHPQSLLALSDAGAHATLLCEAGQTSHFLSRWVRERGIFSLEEGIRRITSMPADIFGISNRGRIQKGLPADLVVFDFAKISNQESELLYDLPGNEPRLVQRANGICWSFVNGQLLISNGKILDHSDVPPPGMLLRPLAN